LVRCGEKASQSQKRKIEILASDDVAVGVCGKQLTNFENEGIC
jgi:hypothetical protein